MFRKHPYLASICMEFKIGELFEDHQKHNRSIDDSQLQKLLKSAKIHINMLKYLKVYLSFVE